MLAQGTRAWRIGRAMAGALGLLFSGIYLLEGRGLRMGTVPENSTATGRSTLHVVAHGLARGAVERDTTSAIDYVFVIESGREAADDAGNGKSAVDMQWSHRLAGGHRHQEIAILPGHVLEERPSAGHVPAREA